MLTCFLLPAFTNDSFAREIVEGEDTQEETQKVDTYTIVNRLVKSLEEQIENDRKYNGKDPVYKALRNQRNTNEGPFFKEEYNSMPLNEKENYANNLEILNQESAKEAVQTVLDEIVDGKKGELKDVAGIIDENLANEDKHFFEEKILPKIKAELLNKIYERLVKSQKSFLEDSKGGGIHKN